MNWWIGVKNVEEYRKRNQNIDAISKNINKGNYQKAIVSFRNLELKNPNDEMIQFNKIGFLIDIGFGLKSQDFVQEGINTGEKFLNNSLDNNKKARIYYNLANGYMSLNRLEYNEKRGIEQIVNNENLQAAKKFFRNAIKNSNHFDSDLKKQLWTNYGNCLDALGRTIEAFYAYDEALNIDSSFSMALGNKAMALKFFADISGKYRDAMYIKSYQMLKSALESDDLIKFGGVEARDIFTKEANQIKTKFNDKSILSKKLEHQTYEVRKMTKFERFYIDYCSKHLLFLNFHIHENNCEVSIIDPIFISLITPVNDQKTFYDLAKYINQIKEDYAIARLLLVQSQFSRTDFDRISKRTTFVNTLDYGIFNIYTGLLKSAFGGAFNILDKIARFIKEYYDLKLNGKVYFTGSDTWQYKDNNELKPRTEILNSKNVSLYALYDIFLDFKANDNKKSDEFKNKNEYQKIKDIRNALTHEKLVIYDSISNDMEENKNNIYYNTMLSQTITLLQLVKSCIIYLINSVQIEEHKKDKNSSESIPSIYTDTMQFL